MEVYVNIRQKAQVNPKDVVEKLIEEEIGFRNWIFEKDGNFYKGYEVGGGSHSWDESEEIEKGRYDYVKALQLVLDRLDN